MKTNILFILIFASISLSAQRLERMVVSSIGATLHTPSLTLKTSVGEPIVSKVNSSGLSLSQGFFSGATSSTATGLNETLPNSTFAVYPNPASDQLYLQYTSMGTHPDHLVIMDILGQPVMTVDPSVKIVSISGISSGAYLIGLYDTGNRLISSSKFIKQ